MVASTATKRTHTRVVVFTTDPVGPEMPGPAIRAWELARALGDHLDVVLASTVSVSGSHPNAETRLAAGPAIRELVDGADVLFAPGALVYMADELRQTDSPVAVDIYDPYHLENLEMGGADQAEADRAVTRLAGVVNAGLRRGDFFTCASERQRDFWLGSLAALGRVNPYNYEASPLLSRLVSVVPFGLPAEPPCRQGPGLRGVVPGIGPDDKVVLWGGGVYNWLDPISLLRAVDRLSRRLPELRLVFLGLRHPNPDVPGMRVATELQELSAQLGLTGRYVFFNTGWAPYGRRADYLLDADVAVSTHLDHLETRYSFRSRVLDYLWAGLPMVLTGGDVLADEVADAGLGIAVPAQDDEALEEALDAVLSYPPPPEIFAPVVERHTWGRAAQPLLDFCASPGRAPDLLVERLSPEAAAGPYAGYQG
ncbi:MAG TPA: glycosyltransferase [Acidimicrobiales bacterium]|nr:glycosyltransferase [Acidimicrobiales bacterium]